MANGAPPSDLLSETLTERAERAAGWLGKHSVPAALAVVVAVVLLCSMAVVTSQREAARRRLTDAYAEALELLDAPLQEELDARRERLAERASARQRAREADAAKAAEARASGHDAASAIDPEEDESAEDAEALRLAEEESEQEEMERLTRGTKTFATARERDLAAREAFATVASQAANKPLGALATIEMAHAASRLHDAADAQAQVHGLYERLGRSDPLWSIVASRWATMLEDQSDVDGALAVLARFNEGEQRLLADEAGVQRARLLRQQNKPEQAREALQDVQLRFPDSPLDEEIRAMLLEMPAATAPSAPSAHAALPTGTPAEASAPAP